MSQKFSLYLDLTVEENLASTAIYGLDRAKIAERIDELAKRLRFDEDPRSAHRRPLDRPCGSASRSPRRCCTSPSCSSSTSRPAASIRADGALFWDLIYELAADRGMTVLVTTHYMDEAEQCDRLAFILDGALIANGSP
jgi:ABC-2 type transport system ATP-binding protein